VAVTEIGDKTFFIAAVLAMRQDRCVRAAAT
jgi:putative Ca2+/H+ antiporter (TMEM165/GDT1 family)